MKVLVTGIAGFIGFHLAQHLLKRGDKVVGIDNLNDYYDPSLKIARLAALGITSLPDPAGSPVVAQHQHLVFYRMDLSDDMSIKRLIAQHTFDAVVHLAAQAGVRHSIVAPMQYISSNITGFAHILEGCRHHGVAHLVYASSSSVYGLNSHMPFSVHDNVDHPVSLYAASKKSNELMAHAYSHLYGLPTTGLRFFTVYGPWGRPDMALFLFTKAILAGEPIKVFNHGKMARDFTYIDDIVMGVMKVLDRPPTGNSDWNPEKPDPASSPASWKIYNIGHNQPVQLSDFIDALEVALGKKAIRQYMDIQPGDVPATYADVGDLIKDFDYRPSTPIEEGIASFVSWYKDYYRIK